MAKIIELGIGEEIRIVNDKTKKASLSITNCDGVIKIREINQNVNEYYSIQTIDRDTIRNLNYLLDYEDHSIKDDVPSELRQKTFELQNIYFDKLYGGANTEDILEEKYQCVVKYQKEDIG